MRTADDFRGGESKRDFQRGLRKWVAAVAVGGGYLLVYFSAAFTV